MRCVGLIVFDGATKAEQSRVRKQCMCAGTWRRRRKREIRKNKKQLQCVKRPFAVNTNIIWIIWELLLSFEKQPIDSLLQLFSIKYKTNKKKKCILHLSVMYIITKVDYNIPILDVSLLKNIEESINIAFEKIKKKEIT